MNAHVGFRVDASARIGSGHVMRCLALADGLRDVGVRSHFICRDRSRHLGDRILEAGHALSLLPPPETRYQEDQRAWLGVSWDQDARETLDALRTAGEPAWLVVDHYGIDARWERRVAGAARRILAIDDLADRAHYCDLLLDSGIGRSVSDYAERVAPTTPALIGPDFALLRGAFAERRAESLRRRSAPSLKQVLVSLGGADVDNVSERVMDALDGCALPPDVHVVVVVGPLSPWRERLQERARRLRYRCEVRADVRDMAGLMLESDLAIGAGGGSALERCVMGLPSIVVVLADNQRAGAEALRRRGAAVVIERSAAIADSLPGTIDALACPDALRAQSRAAAQLADGRGVDRVVERLQAMEG